jgi:hypothetical protein
VHREWTPWRIVFIGFLFGLVLLYATALWLNFGTVLEPGPAPRTFDHPANYP